MLSIIGLIGGLILLITLTMRGMNLLIAAPLSALFLAVLSGLPMFPQLVAEGEANFVGDYMDGFSGFVASWFLMFLLGSVFGKVMEDSRSAESVSKWVIDRIGIKYAVLAVVAACAVLTYGGVSLFIVGFTVFPIALSLFKQANLPRRFIPAALAFGSVTFTMTSAGSPEIQNWIPIPHLGTSPYAGWEVSLIAAIFMMITGYIWLKWMINRATKNGEKFDEREDDPEEVERDLPNPLLSGVPLLVVLIIAFIFHDTLETSALIIALAGGVFTAWLLNRRYLENVWTSASNGTFGALMAIANTAAVVGFGTVARSTPAFETAVDTMTSVPGDPLIGAAIAVLSIVGLTGSASGGMEIALPILGPEYLSQGVNAEALHRVSALSSGALDSLPHGGYTVTTIRVICGETHKSAYPAVAAVTVIVPMLGVILSLVLFSMGVGI
ncbi:H+/gluconate symporter-like permease [Virgibacillus natechei]|uniref:H+/gluconate symporter-like permease n=1 Tax=Virgibacillus natechei TaxID=1216297 RepID=A0ABS4IHI7_9BACI|nr:SLC13 family permease [Virgibacillus natechei]MBP1970040.1 H+/gluconate symporter-like permease [Virgibacillus natechei]UZD14126.1 SLC13 family permease [Virgibacillus natechei]